MVRKLFYKVSSADGTTTRQRGCLMSLTNVGPRGSEANKSHTDAMSDSCMAEDE